MRLFLPSRIDCSIPQTPLLTLPVGRIRLPPAFLDGNKQPEEADLLLIPADIAQRLRDALARMHRRRDKVGEAGVKALTRTTNRDGSHCGA